jgi:ABC-2 type transport system ATP-binding protein
VEALRAAADEFAPCARADDTLALQIHCDGGVAAIRAVLARLDARRIEVQELSVHTPDLDDVFLALTATHDDHEAVTA